MFRELHCIPKSDVRRRVRRVRAGATGTVRRAFNDSRGESAHPNGSANRGRGRLADPGRARDVGDRSARERVWVLRTGFATEPLQDEAIRRLLAGYSGLQVGIVTRERAPEVFALVGERMSAALVRDGRVLKDVTRVDQLAELLHIPHAAARARRYPELQRFDAHMHLVPGGAANWNRILEINHVKKAVVSALPIKKDYEGLDDANALVLETARLYPRLVPFVMISPFRASPLEDLENAVARGARGVKLINGHGDFFEPSKQDIIDPPGLRKMFAFCERRGIPVLWHVSSHLYRVGLLRVLEEFPRLKVILPHMGGYLTYTPETVRRLLSDYPNFYVSVVPRQAAPHR